MLGDRIAFAEVEIDIGDGAVRGAEVDAKNELRVVRRHEGVRSVA